MKYLVLLALLCVAFSSLTLFEDHELLNINSADADRELFRRFLARHGRMYSTQEHGHRFAIFRDNMDRARLFSSLDRGTASYGVTQFADLTPDEFRSAYLRPIAVREGKVSDVANDIPETWDWREQNPSPVTPVSNQGSCGSCWAFSTIENIESSYAVATGKLHVLSKSMLVDCSLGWKNKEGDGPLSGCNGGLMALADEYLTETGHGLMLESDYPYQPYEGKCKYDDDKTVVPPPAGVVIAKPSVDAVKQMVYTTPVSAALNAEWLQVYVGGISDPAFCDPKALDHGIMIVGYGKGKHLGKEIDYFIVRNSWGASWGEDGYFRLAVNKCGIETCVSTATW